MHNPIQSLVVLLVTCSFLVPLAAGQEKKTIRKDVKVEEFDKLRKEKDHIVLDVRTEQEFKAGHIPNAVLIDVRSPDFEKKVKDLDKSKTYLIHCAAGRRSVTACDKLETLGFRNLLNLEGGLRAWQDAAKPIEK